MLERLGLFPERASTVGARVDHHIFVIEGSGYEPPVRGKPGESRVELPPRRRLEPLPGPHVVNPSVPAVEQFARGRRIRTRADEPSGRFGSCSSELQ